MDRDKSPATSSFRSTLDSYENSLITVESSGSSDPAASFIDLLLTRDQVALLVKTAAPLATEDSVRLLDLDQRLRRLAGPINAALSLKDCRATLTPPETAWWWSLQAPAKVYKLDQFDWVWNVLTVTCLVFSASFATQTAKAFSTQGFDLMGTISTITQGAGVVLVAGGALTDKGRKVTEDVLHSLRIPPVFYAEATFGFSALLLGTTVLLNNNLPKVGDTYQRQGDRFVGQGNLVQARKKYKRALDFNAHDGGLLAAAGDVSLKLGELDQAEAYYRQGMALGDPAAMSGLAHTLMIKEIEAKGWNAKIDDLAARRAEIFLDTALNKMRTRSEMEDRILALYDGPVADTRQIANTVADMKLLARAHINQGLLKLIQIDFDALDQDAAKLRLQNALDALAEAVVYEDHFAEMGDRKLAQATDWPELGKAACYQQIVAQLQAEIFYQPGDQLYQLYEDSQGCYNALRSAGLNRYDDAIMYYRLSFKWGDRIPDSAYERPAETAPVP
ncbi:MAG: hypothetical protein ACKO63_04050 [Nodosilinea sp.]